MTVQKVTSVTYGFSRSTIFEGSKKLTSEDYDEDDDPILDQLRFLDYRYFRFIFNPLKSRFVLNINKRDEALTSVKSARAGLDAENRHQKEKIFGSNLIDIREKSIPQLLVDEVPCLRALVR